MGRAVAHHILADVGIAPAHAVTVAGDGVLDDVGPGFALAGIVRARIEAGAVCVDLPDLHPGKQARALERGGQDLEPAVVVQVGDGGKPGLIAEIRLPYGAASFDQGALLRLGHGGLGGSRSRDRGIDVHRCRRGAGGRRGRGLLCRAGAERQAAQKQDRKQF